MITKNSMALRISEEDIPVQKKNARGVYGIRLAEGDEVESVFYLEDGSPAEAEVNGRMIALNRLHIASRGSRGSKIRRQMS